MKTAEGVAKILLKLSAVTLNPHKPFRFTNGILSPVYIDNRTITGYPRERKKIISYFKKLVKVYGKPDVLAGTATAGITWAAWLAAEFNLPMVYVRGEAKGHGKKKQVEGYMKRGQRVVIVEDLISTAKSSLESVVAIKKEGGKVLGIIAIIDYTLPQSKTNLKSARMKLTSLTTFPQAVEMAIKMKMMKEKDRNLVLDWLKNPSEWGKRMGFE